MTAIGMPEGLEMYVHIYVHFVKC